MLRKVGMYLSLGMISTMQTIRAWVSFPRDGIQGVRVILVEGRRVLLVSHWYAPWVRTLPGGGVHKNESLEDAAMREVREETGLVAKSMAGEIGRYRNQWGRGEVVAVFYTGDFEGSLSLKPNLEIMARSWFDIDNLPAEISPANRRRIEAYREGVRGEKGKW